MMWQPNSAQPMAYAPRTAYTQGYAAPQTDGESSAWIAACFALGAAALGGALGVVLFGSLPSAVILAAAGAYA